MDEFRIRIDFSSDVDTYNETIRISGEILRGYPGALSVLFRQLASKIEKTLDKEGITTIHDIHIEGRRYNDYAFPYVPEKQKIGKKELV